MARCVRERLVKYIGNIADPNNTKANERKENSDSNLDLMVPHMPNDLGNSSTHYNTKYISYCEQEIDIDKGIKIPDSKETKCARAGCLSIRARRGASAAIDTTNLLDPGQLQQVNSSVIRIHYLEIETDGDVYQSDCTRDDLQTDLENDEKLVNMKIITCPL